MFQSLFLTTAFAFQTLTLQQINCFPLDPYSNDRAVFTLELPAQAGELPTKGTLFLSSGIGNWGEHESTGVLPLERGTNDPKGKLEFVAGNNSSLFHVYFDRATVGKVTKDMKVQLHLRTRDGGARAEQELTCYANVFEYEQ